MNVGRRDLHFSHSKKKVSILHLTIFLFINQEIIWIDIWFIIEGQKLFAWNCPLFFGAGKSPAMFIKSIR